jgi:uncharacterized protein with von Willebrand factor type A (vWA) domain
VTVGAQDVTVPEDLTATVVLFARRLREAGVEASHDRVQAWLAALDQVGAGDPVDVYWTGRVTLCGDPLDIARYDRVWATVFAGRPSGGTVERATIRWLPDVGPGGRDGGADETEDDDTTALMARASRVERLRHKDVVDLTGDERADLHRLLAALRMPGETRRTRRHRPAHRGTLDRTATVRRLLAAGGEPARLAHRQRRTRPRDVVLLADVSGSMAAYADVLLRFGHATARGHRARTEVFTLGTRLTRVTRELGLRDPDLALRAVGRRVPDWSGGTRLGDTLKEFLDVWGQRGLARGAVVVVLSDGWERGDVSVLGEQMARLARLAHRVVWANPRAGRTGFAPTAGGMAAALPHCDDLVAGHSLEALEHLARVVAGATGGAAGDPAAPSPREDVRA